MIEDLSFSIFRDIQYVQIELHAGFLGTVLRLISTTVSYTLS
jgi:hypothetical protein